MGKLIELNVKGDTTTLWDVADEASVKDVDAKFNELMARGFTLVERPPGQDTFSRTTVFHPEAEEVIGVFPMTGG